MSVDPAMAVIAATSNTSSVEGGNAVTVSVVYRGYRDNTLAQGDLIINRVFRNEQDEIVDEQTLVNTGVETVNQETKEEEFVVRYFYTGPDGGVSETAETCAFIENIETSPVPF